METRLCCGFLFLSLCAYRAYALNATGLGELAVISRADERQTTTTEVTVLATTEQSYRSARWQRHEREGFVASPRGHDAYQEEEVEHHGDDAADDSKAMSQAKTEYWGGYYDFLINEGSYKFWAVFQLATAALLIYSGFAALYYAKVNPTVPDYDDEFFLRRRRRSIVLDRPPGDRPFFGFDPSSLQRILDAIAREVH